MTSFLAQVAQITPNLYLSGFVGASEQTVIKYGITCIITVCREVPKLDMPFVESIKLDVLDKPTEQLERYFDYVTDKINEIATKKGSTLVHCVAGISRSASMCIAYLMKYKNMNLREAHDLVKSKRQFIRPNLGFWRQLIDYEYKLFGKNSIKMITTNVGPVPDIYENEIKNMLWPQATANSTSAYQTSSATATSATTGSAGLPQPQPPLFSLTNTTTNRLQSTNNSSLYQNYAAKTTQSANIYGTTNNTNTRNRSSNYQTTYNSSYNLGLQKR